MICLHRGSAVQLAEDRQADAAVLSMLQSRPRGCRVARSRTASLATTAGMAAFALASRTTAAFTTLSGARDLVSTATMSTGGGGRAARMRASDILTRTSLGASFTVSTVRRAYRGGMGNGDAIGPLSSLAVAVHRHKVGAGRCARQARQKGTVVFMSSQGSAAVAVGSGVELSAEAVALDSQIKAKGEVIRELKTGGAAKDDLKPHIEVSESTPLIVPVPLFRRT